MSNMYMSTRISKSPKPRKSPKTRKSRSKSKSPKPIDFIRTLTPPEHKAISVYQNSSSEMIKSQSPIWEPNILSINPFSSYVTDFELFALDEYNNKIVNFKYSGCFITSLSEISFSHQDEGQITCSASFAYNQLHVNLLSNINKII